MFTYFKAEEYVASSFLFLLLLSGSLNVSEGCLSATDGLHKTLIRIQGGHTAGIQTLTNSQIMLSHLGAHGILSPPSFLFSLSFVPETQNLGKESVLRPHHISCPNFYQLWAVPQLPWPSRGQPVGLTPDWPLTHPAEGNLPPQEISLRSIHGQVWVTSANCLGRETLTHVHEKKCSEG